MKLHLNFPHSFHFGHSVQKSMLYSNSTLNIEVPEISNKISLKKMKANFKKLTPKHWYDGVWNDLDYKM